MTGGNWTAEEYREYLRTGKEPERGRNGTGAEPERNRKKAEEPSRHPTQEEIERAWDRAAKRGEIMAIDIVAEKPKRNKYGNRKAERGWKKFDSEHEARIYDEMMLRVRAGELKCVLRQVKFDLLEQEQLQYIADFVAVYPDMTVEVYDAKSEATRKDKVFVMKKKLMRELWGIEIREV